MHRFFYVFAWVWMIIVGGLLITPGGIFCIVCGATIDASGYIGKPAVFVIGIVSIIIGIIGLVASKKNKRG
jgi:predicted phage tail protein